MRDYDCAYVLSLHTRRFLTKAQSRAQDKHKKNKIFLFLALALAITFFSLHTRFSFAAINLCHAFRVNLISSLCKCQKWKEQIKVSIF